MEFSEIENREKILDHLFLKRKVYIDKVGMLEYDNRKNYFIDKIKQTFATEVLCNYSLYHFLIGGNKQLNCENFDLPGDCSIQKMIEGLPE